MGASRSQPAKAGGLSRREWINWALVLAILIAAGGGVFYWSRHRAPAPDTDPRSPEERAQAELAALATPINEAMTANKLAPMVEKLRGLTAKYPNFAPAHATLGNLLSAVGRPGEAYNEFCRSLDLNPAQPELQINAGTLAQNLGRPEESLKHFTAAVGQDPGNARYRVFRGDAFLKQHQDEKAEIDALKALERDSDCHEAYALLSDLYFRQNSAMALEQIQKAIDHTPPSQPGKAATYARKKVRILIRDARWQDALNTLRGLPTDMLANPDVLEEMALCWMGMGKPADAGAMYEEVLRLSLNAASENNGTADWRLAAGAVKWYLKAGDKTAARRNLNVLKSINPAAPEIADFEKDLK